MSRQAEFDAYYAKLITDGCNQSDAWVRSARGLLSAAEVIMEMINAGRALVGHPDVQLTADEEELKSRSLYTNSQPLMLYAFAIECLLKANYIRNGGTIYVNGTVQKIPGVQASHDLVQITDAVGLGRVFNQEQRTVLDKLTLWTEIGRYPAPLKSTRYGHKFLDDNKMSMRGIWTYRDEETTFQVIELLYSQLGEATPAHAYVLRVAFREQENWRKTLYARLDSQ